MMNTYGIRRYESGMGVCAMAHTVLIKFSGETALQGGLQDSSELIMIPAQNRATDRTG